MKGVPPSNETNIELFCLFVCKLVHIHGGHIHMQRADGNVTVAMFVDYEVNISYNFLSCFLLSLFPR